MNRHARPLVSSPPRQDRKTQIVAWAPTGLLRERVLAQSLGDQMHLVCCGTEQALLDAVLDPDVRVLLLELGLNGRPSALSLVIAARELYPAMVLIGYGWLSQEVAAEIVVCSKAGLNDVAMLGLCDIGQVVRRALAEDHGARDIVLNDLSSVLPQVMMPMVRVLLARLRDGLNVAQVARLLGRSPRTLQREASGSGCCSPSQLAECARLLVVGYLLSRENSSLEHVSRETGKIPGDVPTNVQRKAP